MCCVGGSTRRERGSKWWERGVRRRESSGRRWERGSIRSRQTMAVWRQAVRYVRVYIMLTRNTGGPCVMSRKSASCAPPVRRDSPSFPLYKSVVVMSFCLAKANRLSAQHTHVSTRSSSKALHAVAHLCLCSCWPQHRMLHPKTLFSVRDIPVYERP